jgi:hypothetical protein
MGSSMPSPAVKVKVVDKVNAADERGPQLPIRRKDEVLGLKREGTPDLRSLLTQKGRINGKLTLALKSARF